MKLRRVIFMLDLAFSILSRLSGQSGGPAPLEGMIMETSPMLVNAPSGFV
jgi:hypothetical protein